MKPNIKNGDGYSKGISNEDINASAYAAIFYILFWGCGISLTVLEGLSK